MGAALTALILRTRIVARRLACWRVKAWHRHVQCKAVQMSVPQWVAFPIVLVRFAAQHHVHRAGEQDVKIGMVVLEDAAQMVSWLPTLNAELHLADGR